MKRKTLDAMFSVGGIALAGLLAVLGLVMTSNAKFAKDYVKDQLSQQHIIFKPAVALTAEESESSCLVKYAGQALTTGKQAECYANDFIGLHVKAVANDQTYADLGAPQTALTAQVAAAQKAGDQKAGDPATADLQKQLSTVTAQRELLFKGETLRGLLLTSFGFSVFGVKGEQVATVAYLVAGLLVLLSMAGLAHAFRTSRNETTAALDHPYGRVAVEHRVGV